jgi:hypothetical protein
MMITETSHCVKSPAKGASKGLLLAKKDEHGRTPSRPSSWTTVQSLAYAIMYREHGEPLPCVNRMLMRFPSVDKAIIALRICGLRKK